MSLEKQREIERAYRERRRHGCELTPRVLTEPQKPTRTAKTCPNCFAEFKRRAEREAKTFCSNKCSNEFRTKELFTKYLDLFNQGKLLQRRHIYKCLVARDGDKCQVCSITEWNGKPIRLWVDHVDGYASNNNPSNLRLICPNCDSQSPTFGARNKGKGRKSLGLKQYS